MTKQLTFFRQRGLRSGKRGSQPENLVKNSILEYFSIHHRQGRAFAFTIKNLGVFDASKKLFRKDNSRFFVKGVSDICAFWKRKDGTWITVFIECKAGKNKASDDQVIFLDQVISCGCMGIIAWSLDDVRQILESL